MEISLPAISCLNPYWSRSTLVVLFFFNSSMMWSLRCSHKRRQGRGSEKQSLLHSQVLEGGGPVWHSGPHGEAPGRVSGSKRQGQGE